VDLINSLLRGLIGGYGRLFGDAHPLVSLTPLSIVVGVGMLWVFARTSDQKAIEQTKKKLGAYLLEMRLFGDDLAMVYQSQKNLFLTNLRYIALMLKPALYLTVPVVLLMIHMDAFYGRAPLRAGEAAVVSVQAAEGTDMSQAPRLQCPPGIVAETPAVRATAIGQFSWRIRAQAPADGNLAFEWNGARWEKSITAGETARYVSSRRVSSLWDAIWDPGEDRLNAAGVAWVQVPYAVKTIEFAGLDLHWVFWFLIISIVSAYLLKGYFHVVI
jgi:uncharacterized membrane protein (DUF106 family)